MNKDNILYVLKVLGLFLVLSFVIDKVVYFSLNKISDKVYSGQSVGKLNHYLMTKDSLDFVIYGSSRANHNINPIGFSEKSFNMGVDGRMIAYSATLIKLLPKNKQQIVLLHVDTSNAFNNKYKGKDLDALSIKYNRNSTIKHELNRLNQNNPLQMFYWTLDYNGKVLGIIKNLIKPKYNYKNYNGFDPIFPTDVQKNIFKNKLKKKKKVVCKEQFELNSIYEMYLNELKDFSIKNNKTLIIFTSPLFNDYCKKDNVYFEKLMKEKGIIYYDFSDFFKNNNSLEYWKDPTHLSSKGANIFTDSIVKKVKFLLK